MIRIAIAAILYAMALFVFFSEVFGLYRFKYVLNRMHAAAMGDTLGIMLIVAGTIVLRGWSTASLKLVLILVFMLLAGPAATHLIAGGEVSANERAGEEYTQEDRR